MGFKCEDGCDCKNKDDPSKGCYIRERHYEKQIAQESWVVIKGKVQLFFYDIDGTLLRDDLILNAGDASFTLYGGHTYKILEEDTIVYEYKTGPYEGQELDKVFI